MSNYPFYRDRRHNFAATNDHTIYRARYRITGNVQGVSYRYWTVAKASTLYLSGWVENQADGSVIALLIGKKWQIAEMAEALLKGPLEATVRHVVKQELTEEDKQFKTTEFTIRH